MNNLAKLYMGQGRHTDAEPYAAAAVSGAEAMMSTNHPTLALFRSVHGRALVGLGRSVAAERTLLECHAVLTELDGMSEDTHIVARALIVVYDELSALHPEEKYGAKAAAWRAQLEMEDREEADDTRLPTGP